jgi:hypothetical protein
MVEQLIELEKALRPLVKAKMIEVTPTAYLLIVFNFDKPETKDLTETVRLLADCRSS